jgi:hypothetical protein
MVGTMWVSSDFYVRVYVGLCELIRAVRACMCLRVSTRVYVELCGLIRACMRLRVSTWDYVG